MTNQELLVKFDHGLSNSLYAVIMNVERLALKPDCYEFFNVYYDTIENVFRTIKTKWVHNDNYIHLITIDRRVCVFDEKKRNYFLSHFPALVEEDIKIIKRRLSVNGYFEDLKGEK